MHINKQGIYIHTYIKTYSKYMCPPRCLHLTFFFAPQWNTFLVMVCPDVWHFLNSSIKQLSFTTAFGYFSVRLSDFHAVVKLDLLSWWNVSFRWSTDATLHKPSAGGGDWDEVLTETDYLKSVKSSTVFEQCSQYQLTVLLTEWNILLHRNTTHVMCYTYRN